MKQVFYLLLLFQSSIAFGMENSPSFGDRWMVKICGKQPTKKSEPIPPVIKDLPTKKSPPKPQQPKKNNSNHSDFGKQWMVKICGQKPEKTSS